MHTALRAVALTLAAGLVTVTVAANAAVAPPPPPSDVELHAGADSSITIEWAASPGATSYRIYRGTTAGGEGNTPIATTTTATTYKDANLSSTPVYFYQITAVNAGGESALDQHFLEGVKDLGTHAQMSAGDELEEHALVRAAC